MNISNIESVFNDDSFAAIIEHFNSASLVAEDESGRFPEEVVDKAKGFVNVLDAVANYYTCGYYGDEAVEFLDDFPSCSYPVGDPKADMNIAGKYIASNLAGKRELMDIIKYDSLANDFMIDMLCAVKQEEDIYRGVSSDPFKPVTDGLSPTGNPNLDDYFNL